MQNSDTEIREFWQKCSLHRFPSPWLLENSIQAIPT